MVLYVSFLRDESRQSTSGANMIMMCRGMENILSLSPDNNNRPIPSLKTDKLQLQTLKWYTQVLYKRNTDIKTKEKQQHQ